MINMRQWRHVRGLRRRIERFFIGGLLDDRLLFYTTTCWVELGSSTPSWAGRATTSCVSRRPGRTGKVQYLGSPPTSTRCSGATAAVELRRVAIGLDPPRPGAGPSPGWRHPEPTGVRSCRDPDPPGRCPWPTKERPAGRNSRVLEFAGPAESPAQGNCSLLFGVDPAHNLGFPQAARAAREPPALEKSEAQRRIIET